MLIHRKNRLKWGLSLKDLKSSMMIFDNVYKELSLQIDFKLHFVKGTNKDSIECKEYEIKGIQDNDTCCFLRYQIIKGQIDVVGRGIITEEILSIEDINVNEDYRKQGLAMKMYQLLSDIYIKDFAGYKIIRKFVNPYAEYVFRKAVQDKKVDKTLLQNSKIERRYDSTQKKIFAELMKNLSPEYREDL